MNTAIQGVYNGFSVANLAQVLAYTEGSASRALNPITLTTSTNYSRVYTLTLTVISANHSNINITQAVTAGPLLVKSGAVYTISSEYTNAQGVKLNNWAYFKLAIQGLTLQFANTDWGSTFDIQALFTDGATTESSIIQIVTTAVPDATGNNQTLTVPMSMNGKTLVTLGGTNLAINDVNQAAKTYRVTYTANDNTNTTGTSYMRLGIQHGGTDTGWQTSYTLTGTQTYINDQISSNGSDYDGLYFVNYAPEFQGQTSVSYVQEVLTTTEVGVTVPYIQETGTLVFNTAYTAPFTIGSNPTYTEDSSVTFSLGSITDLAGVSFAHETCGLHRGYNCYTVTATVLGSFSGTNPVFLTYAGDPGVNNSITFTGTRTAVNALISSVQLIPPADHTGALTIQVVVTRGNTPETIFTGNITATCSSVHAEKSIIGGTSFILGNNDINFGSVTDAAIGKNYTATIDCGQSSATFGTLTDLSGLGTWNATGGTSGFGRLTITGTKAQLNTSLAGIRYTTGAGSALTDNIVFTYTQTQNTNVVSQGVNIININNAYLWGSGNTGSGFAFDENSKITYNLGRIETTIAGTATAEIILSTAFSTANGGVITGWTKVSDTVWTISGTRTAVNAALAATEIVPPADRRTSFAVDMKIYDGAVVKYDSISFAATRTFAIRSTYPYISAITPLQLSVGGDSAVFNLGSVVDVRSTNISTAITYSVVLTPSSLTQITSMSSAGSGGTTSWSGTALTLTGTKTQVNSHLAAVTINYLGSVDSTISWAQTQTTNSTTQGPATINVLKTVPQYMFLSGSTSARTNDLSVWDIDTLPTTNSYLGQYPTYMNNTWVVPKFSTTNSDLQFNKSTATSWTTQSYTTSMPNSGLNVVISNAKTGAGARVYTYSNDWSEAGYTYTTNDSSFTNIVIGSSVSTDVSFGGNTPRFHLMHGDNYTFNIRTSTNGTTWSADTTFSGSRWNEITFGYIQGSTGFILPYYDAYTSTLALRVSTDGVTWPIHNKINFINGNYRAGSSAITGNNIWMVASYNVLDSNKVYISKATNNSSPTSWTTLALNITYNNPTPKEPNLVTNDAGVWLFRNGQKLYRSSGALTSFAEVGFSFAPYAIYSIKFMNSKFYALVAETNNNCKLMESTDGITWSVRYTFPSGQNFTTMAYTS